MTGPVAGSQQQFSDTDHTDNWRRLQRKLNNKQEDVGETTVTTVSGSGADAEINSNLATIAAQINGIRTAQRQWGLMA